MPVNRRSVTMMPNSGSEMNLFSNVVEGDSFYGYSDGLHTIQVIYAQFVGRFRIQCTLSLDPTEDEWFDIIPDITTGDAWNPEGYIQFTTANPSDISEGYTFRGNYTYIRCYLDRRYIADGVTYDPSYGQISRIILSS